MDWFKKQTKGNGEVVEQSLDNFLNQVLKASEAQNIAEALFVAASKEEHASGHNEKEPHVRLQVNLKRASDNTSHPTMKKNADAVIAKLRKVMKREKQKNALSDYSWKPSAWLPCPSLPKDNTLVWVHEDARHINSAHYRCAMKLVRVSIWFSRIDLNSAREPEVRK